MVIKGSGLSFPPSLTLASILKVTSWAQIVAIAPAITVAYEESL